MRAKKKKKCSGLKHAYHKICTWSEKKIDPEIHIIVKKSYKSRTLQFFDTPRIKFILKVNKYSSLNNFLLFGCTYILNVKMTYNCIHICIWLIMRNWTKHKVIYVICLRNIMFLSINKFSRQKQKQTKPQFAVWETFNSNGKYTEFLIRFACTINFYYINHVAIRKKTVYIHILMYHPQTHTSA